MELWGPGLDAEVAYRTEQIVAAGTSLGRFARRGRAGGGRGGRGARAGHGGRVARGLGDGIAQVRRAASRPATARGLVARGLAVGGR